MEKHNEQKPQQHKPPVGQVAYRSPPPAPAQQQQQQQQQPPPPSQPPRHSAPAPAPYYGPPPGHYPHHPYYPPPPTHHHPSAPKQQQQQQRPSGTTNITASSRNTNISTKAATTRPTKNHASAHKKKSFDNNDGIIAPELGGVYAPILRAQYKRKVDNAATVPLPRRVIGGLRDQLAGESNTKSCTCSQTGCLKVSLWLCTAKSRSLYCFCCFQCVWIHELYFPCGCLSILRFCSAIVVL